MDAADHSQDTQSMLVSTFSVNGALFAIDTLRVQEVIRLGPTTRVHHAPPYVVGITNLRGRIVTILDLGLKLALPAVAAGEHSRVIIVEDHDEPVGLLVDRVGDVLEIDRAALEAPPSNVRGVQGDLLQGVCQAGGHLMAILAPERVLGVEAA